MTHIRPRLATRVGGVVAAYVHVAAALRLLVAAAAVTAAAVEALCFRTRSTFTLTVVLQPMPA